MGIAYGILNFYYRLFLFHPQIQSTNTSHSLNVSTQILLLSRQQFALLYYLYLLSAPAWIHSSCHKQGQVRLVTAILKTIQLISNSRNFQYSVPLHGF